MKFRRRREGKTNYRKRLALLKSGKIRLVVRRCNNNIIVQFIQYKKEGDNVVYGAISKKLKNYGWRYHTGNIPSGYLIGLLAGKKAIEKGVKEVVLDLGLQTSTKQNVIYSVVKGVIDAGISVAVSEEMLPDEKRLTGQHIVEYVKVLLKNNKPLYEKQFSHYVKNNIDPEKIPENFELVKKAIMSGCYG